MSFPNNNKQKDYKNFSSKALYYSCSQNPKSCKYFTTNLDPILHCNKDIGLGICSYERIDISKPERLKDFIDKYLDSIIQSKIIKE